MRSLTLMKQVCKKGFFKKAWIEALPAGQTSIFNQIMRSSNASGHFNLTQIKWEQSQRGPISASHHTQHYHPEISPAKQNAGFICQRHWCSSSIKLPKTGKEGENPTTKMFSPEPGATYHHVKASNPIYEYRMPPSSKSLPCLQQRVLNFLEILSLIICHDLLAEITRLSVAAQCADKSVMLITSCTCIAMQSWV